MFAADNAQSNKKIKDNTSSTTLNDTNEKSQSSAADNPSKQHKTNLTNRAYQQYNKSVEELQSHTHMKHAANLKINKSYRSVSLNDLLDADNDLSHLNKPNSISIVKTVNIKSNSIKKKAKTCGNTNENTNSTNNLLIINEKIKTSSVSNQPFYLPHRKQSKQQLNSPHSPHSHKSLSPVQPPVAVAKKSILKNSESNNMQKNLLSQDIFKRMDKYKEKHVPKERLEIDILPSYLNFANNKLLIASSLGKIRIIDLFSYKIQKDELKSIVINGICKPKSADSDTYYAVSNGEMNSRDDELNVSNSIIIVTKSELKVLKKNSSSDNDNYMFSNPSGLCYDMFDNLYVCDSGNNRIKVLDRGLAPKSVIEAASGPDDRLSQPESVATLKNVLFVCDSANHRIVSYFILNGGDEFKYKASFGLGYGNEPGMLRYPLDVCVDNLGILSVRDHHNNRVQIFSPDSVPFHFIEVNALKETIYSMAVADNGDIYVAKMVHVQEIDQAGQLNTTNKYYIDIY